MHERSAQQKKSRSDSAGVAANGRAQVVLIRSGRCRILMGGTPIGQWRGGAACSIGEQRR
jgi:hypothetical protein